jgi:hypothetical protein
VSILTLKLFLSIAKKRLIGAIALEPSVRIAPRLAGYTWIAVGPPAHLDALSGAQIVPVGDGKKEDSQ